MFRVSTNAHRLNLFLLASILPSMSCAGPKDSIPAAAADDAVLAISDVTVLPLDREVILKHQNVVIVGRSITAIGPVGEVAVPTGAIVIDGKDRYLMPGLADMHAHLRYKAGHLPQDYLRQGIMTVRNMAGEASHLEFRDKVRSGVVAGPMFFTTGQPLTSSDLFPSHRLVATADEGRAAVREQVAQGYDFIKVYSLLSLEAFDAIVDQARELEVPVVGHISDQVPVHHALEAGLSSTEHFFGYFWALESETSTVYGKWDARRLFHAVEIDASKLGPLATATAEANVWNCPTLWRKNNYMTAPMAKKAWKNAALRELAESNRRQFVKALHDAGAGLLAGSDDQAAILHEELALFVDAGLTPYEALRTATVNAGEYLGIPGLGTVTVGSPANLLLLRANPLEAIENTKTIKGVVVNGAWMPR